MASAFIRCAIPLLFSAGSLAAQVAVIPSNPPYNIQVLPGSTRQINVNITGGTLNTVNWSVLSTTGGASATFTDPAAANVSTITAGLPTVQVNIGPGTGNCTIPQPASAMGSYTVTSTATVTVQAQSVDDPTKNGTFLFNVCAKTTTVMVAPAYQQAFMGQHRTLQSWVSGDSDETGTWSIVSQPSGGNGTLADTTNRDTDFAATVTGRYTVQYTSHSDPTKSSTAIVYVSPNPLPAYLSTPDKTEPRECFVDPAFSGGDYEVGAGKQYPSLQSTPVAGTLAPGSITRVWNTDTTGSSPSTYHEYYQITATGTPTQPIILCGVPDSLGNLPVIDGSNATGQSAVYSNGVVAGQGIISVWPVANGRYLPFGYWQNGSAGPSYVTVTGLHIVHGTANYNYTPPGGGPLTPYILFTSCLNIRSGSYIDLGGNHLDTCGNGVFTNDDGSDGWVLITQLVTLTGNHVQNAGFAGDDSDHGAYLQSWYSLVQGNLFDDYNPQAGGADIKWRGVEGIFRYNNIASGASRPFDLVEEQDATSYITFDGYLGLPGDTNCNDSVYCQGDTAGPNILAAYQESFQKDFIYGNEVFGRSSIHQIHYLADSGSGMNVRNGTLYFFSNTLDAAQEIFDTGSNGQGFYGYFPARIDARNNIFWPSVAPYNGASIQMAFGTESTIIMSATTNLIKAGTFTIQPPIEGAIWQYNTQEGWSSTCDGACQWPLSVPLDPHLYGLTNANYLTTSTQPYDPTTMIPPTGSAAIDAGTAQNGILQTMPLRWQYSIAANSLVPRLNPQTIGAVDFAAEAATPTFSPSGGSYTTAPMVSIETTTPLASIYYTTDGSTPTYPITGTTQLYSAQITVAASETVQAIATAAGYVNSSVGSATYTISNQKTTPTITWAPPAAITYGTALSATQLNATSSVAGSFSYSPALGTVLTAGSQTLNLTFTPTDTTDYSTATSSVGLTVNKATPVITWTTPAAIPYGVALSATQLDATSALPGTFSYSPTLGTVLAAGSQSLTATFTPADTTDYLPANTSVTLSVIPPASAPVFVQQCSGYNSFGTTASCTLSGVSAGHTLVIGVAGAATIGGTVTSSAGTPTLAVQDGRYLSAYLLTNVSAGNITITYTAPANTKIHMSVAEYGSTAASPLDGVASFVNTGTGNTVSTPNFITTTASDLLWSYCGTPGGANLTPGSTPIVWTARPSPNGTGLLVLVEDGVTTNPGPYSGQCNGPDSLMEIVSLALKP